jgi:hypothetical protein
VTDHHYRRREADRAQERAERAALLGDQVAYIVATARAEAARRRREAWDGERANQKP